MIRKLMAAAFAMALLLGAGACSSDDDDDSGSDGGGGDAELVEQIQAAAAEEGEEVSDSDAQCLADALVITLGEAEAREAIEGGSAAIEEAMGGFVEAMVASDDPEAGLQTMEDLQALSDECLALFDLTREDVEDPLGTDG